MIYTCNVFAFSISSNRRQPTMKQKRQQKFDTQAIKNYIAFIKECDKKIEKAINTEYLSIVISELRRKFNEQFIQNGILIIPKHLVEVETPKTIYGCISNIVSRDIGDRNFENSLKLYAILKQSEHSEDFLYERFSELPELSKELFFYYLLFPKTKFEQLLQKKIPKIRKLFEKKGIESELTRQVTESINRQKTLDKAEKLLELVFFVETMKED